MDVETRRVDDEESADSVFARRWVARRLLSRGAATEVWLVEDLLTPGVFGALKRALGGPVDSPRAARLAAEYRMLRAIAHPNLPEALDWRHDVGEGSSFLVTRFIDGVTLDAMAPSERRALVLPLLASVLRALSFLHARGVLHLDVKPSNVIWDAARAEAVLIDLDLAGVAAAARGRGTAPFAAPEVMAGEALPDARSDLFSVGVLAYGVLGGDWPTGALPASDLELSAEHPEWLRAFVRRMTSASPELRPRSAREALRILRASGERIPLETAATRNAILRRPPLTGRRAAMHALLSAVPLRRERGKSAGVALVHGPSGHGKTRLVEEGLSAWTLAGARVICCEPERGPLRTLGIVRTLLDRLEILTGIPAAWEAVELRADRHGLVDRLAGEVLRRVRARRTVFVFEDVQDFDPASRLFVLHLLRRVVHEHWEARGRSPCEVVLTTHLPELRDDSLRSWLEQTVETGAVVSIPLEPLDGRATSGLVRRMVAPEPVRRPVLDFLHDVTGGVPLFVIETLLANPLNARGSGTLLGSIARQLPARDEVPASLDAVVRRRLARVPHAVREDLRRLAVAEQPLATDEAQKALMVRDVPAMLASGLATLSEGMVQIADVPLRQVLRGELEPASAQELEDRMTASLEAAAADQHRILRARLRGSDPERAALETHELVPILMARGNEEEASGLLELMLRVRHLSPFLRRVARLRLTDLALQRGQLRRAHTLIADVLGEAALGDPGAQRRLSQVHSREGNWVAARQSLEALRRRPEFLSPIDQLAVAVDLAEVLNQSGHVSDARATLTSVDHVVARVFPLAHLRERISEDQEPRGPRFRWPGLAAQAVMRWLVLLGELERGNQDYTLAFRAFMAAMKLQARLADLPGQGRVLHGLGTLHMSTGRNEEAERFLRRVVGLRQHIGDLAGLADSANNLGVLMRRMGRAADAIEQFRESLRLRRQIGHVSGEVWSCINIANVHVERRDLLAAERYLKRALEVSRRLGDLRSQAQILNNMGAVQHMRDRPLHALRCYREAEALDRSVGNIGAALARRLNMAEEYVRLGVKDRAARLLAVVRRVLTQRNDRELQRRAILVSARLEAAEGRWPEALSLLEALLAERGLDADTRAEASLDAAAVALRAGQPERARGFLPAAPEGLSPEAELRVALMDARVQLASGHDGVGLCVPKLVEGARFAHQAHMPQLAHECAFLEARIRTHLGDLGQAQSAWLRACDALENVLAGVGEGQILKCFLQTTLVTDFASEARAFAARVRPITRTKVATQASDLMRGLRTTLLEAGYRGDGAGQQPRRMDEALARVLQLGRTLKSTAALDELLREAVDGVVAYCRAERGYLITVDERGRLRVPMARTRDRENIQDAFEEISRSIVQRVVETGRGVRIENAAVEGGFEHRESVVNLELRSVLCAPLLRSDQVTGVIYVDHRARVAHFDDTDLELLDLFATQVAIALENAHLVRQFTRDEKIRVMGNLAGGVAHDFNNLLAGIIGWAETLQDPARRDELDHGLETILKAARDGAAAVRRLQDFTRVRRGSEFEAVNVADAVKSCVEFTRGRWEGDALRSGYSIRMQTEVDPELYVRGNPTELREVLTNLILNSVHALARGGIITLTAAAEGDKVHLAVEDDGVGMTEEVRESIFDPYFTTKGREGSGLGMSIVYSIIMRHQGTLRVDSAPGEGTRVHIELPRTEPAPKTSAAALDDAAKSESGRILVVDDEPAILELLTGLLERRGYEVSSAHDGAAAFRLLEASTFDLVLTDLGMVPLTGFDVARKARQLHPQIKVAMVTGWAGEMDAAAARRQFVDAVVTKPFSLPRVLEVVKNLLTRDSDSPEGTPGPQEV